MQHFLECYDVGTLITYQGIGEGIENTNYFVDTSTGQYVLTLFEQMSAESLPYFLNLMAYFADSGLPVPHPIADKNNHYLQKLCTKPATLITRLNGYTIQDPGVNHCRQIGEILGTMHKLSKGFNQNQPNRRDLTWFQQCGGKVMPLLEKQDMGLLQSELDYQQSVPIDELPQGIIHADLFRDNALFNKEDLTGLIDFYYACDGAFLYDLAVTVNDWCTQEDGAFNLDKYQALVTAYRQSRPFQTTEHHYWQDVLRRAALRFWLSRLQDKYFPRPGAITHIKDPDFFRTILIKHQQQSPQLC